MVAADWIIDLGPGAGDEGGQVVAEGTPEDVARSGTFTGQVLAKALRSRRIDADEMNRRTRTFGRLFASTFHRYMARMRSSTSRTLRAIIQPKD